MGDYSESGEDQDVDLGVAEESKNMLEENGVSPPSDFEKGWRVARGCEKIAKETGTRCGAAAMGVKEGAVCGVEGLLHDIGLFRVVCRKVWGELLVLRRGRPP